MLKSMTGYGVAEGEISGSPIRVEIRSLNSRYFDFSARLPAFLIPIESEIKKIVNEAVKRGKVSVFISINGNSSFPSSFSIDRKKVSFYISELKKVGKKEGINGSLELKDLLSFPDIFVSKQKSFSSKKVREAVLPIVRKALQNFGAMKKKEGANISKDIGMRIKKVVSLTNVTEKKAEKEPVRLKERLNNRLKKNNLSISLNEERLEQEVAYLVDRSDITEELTRLKSHCDLFSSVLKGSGEAGKRLEFITQEMNREANTIGSKSQNPVIAQNVIAIKLEIEKVREQIQNIE
jgi:uncharacterized protein (TIGR00255 family)